MKALDWAVDTASTAQKADSERRPVHDGWVFEAAAHLAAEHMEELFAELYRVAREHEEKARLARERGEKEDEGG